MTSLPTLHIRTLLKPATTILAIAALLFVVFGQAPHAEALSGNQFQAGRIIDDGVFFNGNGLTAQEIQTFLNAKVPTCDTNGTQQYGGTTAGQYGASKGSPPPYTCLKDFRQTTVAKPYEEGLCKGYPQLNQSAAEIIYGVAQSCGVSPRVLIVLLQKEQGLITDDWPWPVQYRSATGYGCPDTAPCDTEYYGFFNQVYHAARQFKRYARNSNDYNYIANRNNYIQYNPTSSCGGSTIFIQNQATAGLYNYTPYQPNQAALNNIYGEGDGCSAYGNRNFWRWYNDWFGSTYTPNYYWLPTNQFAYTDNNKTTLRNTYSLLPGDRMYVQVKVKNAGLSTWRRGQINIATSQPQDRKSAVKDWTWINDNRAATLVESTVAPGETGTFEFWITAPSTPGTYKEYFNLVAEGVTWMNDMGLYFEFGVNPFQLSWQYITQYAYTDSSKTNLQNTYQLATGQRYYLAVQAKNTGNFTWLPGQVNLGTSLPRDRKSPFKDWTWINDNRAATIKESSVAPGETGTFEFWITAPSTSTTTKEYFNIVRENYGWMNDLGLYFGLGAGPARYIWQPAGQSTYTSAAKDTAVNPNNLTKNGRYYAVVKAKNNGNIAWRRGQINIATSQPQDRKSAVKDWTWINDNRAATLVESTVAPGETGTFEFWITAPSTPGTYKEYFNLVAEGVTWMNDMGLYFEFGVN